MSNTHRILSHPTLYYRPRTGPRKRHYAVTNPALRAQVRPFVDRSYRSYRYMQLNRPPASLATMPNEILSQIHGYLPPAAQSAMRRVSRQMYPLPPGQYPPFYNCLRRQLKPLHGTKVIAQDLDTGAFFVATCTRKRHFQLPNVTTLTALASPEVAATVLTSLGYVKKNANIVGKHTRVVAIWNELPEGLGFSSREYVGAIDVTIENIVRAGNGRLLDDMCKPIDMWDPKFTQ